MKVKLKRLSDQVIVITGASSGIGLVTARRAARRGARVVLAARNAEALKRLSAELQGQGFEAIDVVADVGDMQQVRHIAEVAIDRFGGFDTWINNAGVSIYGNVEQVELEDQRRLFDTNYWGVVHGSLAAVEHLKRRGGALINLGSELSEVGVPLQAAYVASKHAVKGFTDVLRIELQATGTPISVTLIRPAGVDTMFVPHARNYLDVEPKLPPPLYAPEIVADAILRAAQYPMRDVYVGGVSRVTTAGARAMPRMTDWMMSTFAFSAQRSHEPARPRDQHALYRPTVGMRERQGAPNRVMERSIYTSATTHRRASTMLLLSVGVLAWILLSPKRSAPLIRLAKRAGGRLSVAARHAPYATQMKRAVQGANRRAPSKMA